MHVAEKDQKIMKTRQPFSIYCPIVSVTKLNLKTQEAMSIIKTKEDALSRSAVWVLGIIFCYAFSFASIAFLPVYLRHTMHCSLLTIGVSLSVYGIGIIIASFYGAKLCDLFSAYLVSTVSLVLYIIGLTMIYFISEPYWLFVLTLLVIGMANSAFLPASRMLLMRYCAAPAQLRANGLRYMLYNIGAAASLGISGFLANDNYLVVILFSIIFNILALSLLLIFVKNEGPEHRANIISKKEKHRFWHDPFFAFIFAGLFLGMLVFTQLTSSFSLFLTSVYHFNMHTLSFIFIINAIIIGALQMPIIKYIQRLPQVFIMMLAPTIMGVGFCILLLDTNITIVVISIIFVTIGEMLFMPVSQNLVYQKAQDHLKGQYMGVYQACYAITVVISPLIGTTTLQMDDQGRILWLLILFISVLPITGYFYFRKKISGILG